MVIIKDVEQVAKAQPMATKSKRDNGLSANLTLINFLKGMIGPGCFSLPLAFKNAGLWMAFALVFIIGFLCCVCMMKLVRCSQYLAALDISLSTLDYGQMAEESFKHGSKRLRWLGPAVRVFVNLCLSVLQIGVCSIFYIFVCDHAMEIAAYVNSDASQNKIYYMLGAFLPFLVVTLVRNIRLMSYISLVGNVFMITSIVIIFGQLIIATHDWIDLPGVTDFNGIVLAAGSIIYSFEGQAMVLPLENRMKHGSEMRGWTGVLTTGMSLVTVVYAASGFYGYITYGQNVSGSITLNLPDNQLNLTVKILLMLVIFTGFPVQMYPVVESLWPYINDRLYGYNKGVRAVAHYALRVILFLLAVLLAASVPNLEDLIPLVGVSAGMLLALIIPSILDTNTFLPVLLDQGLYLKASLLVIENGFHFLIGAFFLVAGINSNVQHLMNKQ